MGAGHIAGSTHVPLSELPGRAADIPAAAPLVVVCRVGGRSAQVTAWLSGQGRDAANLAGGLDAWAGAGRPLVTDDGAPAPSLAALAPAAARAALRRRAAGGGPSTRSSDSVL